MKRSIINFIFLTLLIASACGAAAAQGADNGPLFPIKPEDDKNAPAGIREMMKKLEIEKDKKEFAEMQDRGKQALELAAELEKTFASGTQLTDRDRAKLDTLEKLVKRIRKDLGGSDTSDPDDPDNRAEAAKPSSVSEGFKALQSVTVKFVDELQKTSRFTVSTAAIRSSNSVLRLTRYLKFWK